MAVLTIEYTDPATGRTLAHCAAGAPLSPREIELLDALASGVTYKEIALQWRRSTKTLHAHMLNVKIKLDARTTAHAVAIHVRAQERAEASKNATY